MVRITCLHRRRHVSLGVLHLGYTRDQQLLG